jgi:c(7)-type cytochrome triheme protein
MRNIIIVITAISLTLVANTTFAVSSGKTIEFKGSPVGVVTFDGATHQKAVTSCKDCHKEGLFPKMKQGTVKITMKEIYAGNLCGVCHNGKKAFEAKANCERCHKK